MIDVGSTFEKNEILLTGGNGFVGKVLLALLLDRYPQCKHLHVLIRPRENLSAEERFTREVLASPPLAKIVERLGPEFIQRKITVWSGDVSRPNCGIDAGEHPDWAGNVGLILNCAGLVEFFPPVDQSLRANVDSVERLTDLAREIGARLLHVSTCYVAGKADGLVEETEPITGYYPGRQGAGDDSFDHRRELARLRRRVEQIRDSFVSPETDSAGSNSRQLDDKLADLGRECSARWGWVNTYTYAKSLGEQVLAEQQDVPWTIVRPAIVESSLQFPFPGWIEGGRTAAPLVLMALGGLRDWPARPDIALEVVPVDLVAGAILVAAALLLEGRHQPVYQLGAADVNPFEMAPLIELLAKEARKESSPGGGSWVPRLPAGPRLISAAEAERRQARLQRRIQRAGAWLGSLRRAGLPGGALFGSLASTLRTKGLQAKFRAQVLDQYLPFMLENRYIFEANRIREAYRLITPADRQKLPWEPEKIDWAEYWTRNQIGGIKKWIQPEAVKGWSFKI